MLLQFLNRLRFNLKIKHKKSSELIKFVNDRPGHDRRYAINSSKISKCLNWSAKYKFEEGLAETVKWYLKNKDWWEPLL